MVWFAGGHDGSEPGALVDAEVHAWFDHHLAGRGSDPGTGFGYAVDSGIRSSASARTGRTVQAAAYPGLAGGDPVRRDPLPLRGGPQQVLNPPGGSPAAITSIPGASGTLGSNTAGRLAALTAELPGQSATFTSDPLDAQLLLAGSAQLRVSVSRVPGQPSGPEAVLFGKLYELGEDGRRTLLGGAVAPFRVPVPADGGPAEVTVTLPGVVAPVEEGNRLAVAISSTDQGYAGPARAGGLAARCRRPARRPQRPWPAQLGEHRAARAGARHRHRPRGRGAGRDRRTAAAPPPRAPRGNAFGRRSRPATRW